jgi:LacI family transcriptional regulator
MTRMHTRRVALLIDTTRAYGREVLRGAWHYIQEHGPWSILFRPTSFEQPLPE